jgi:hypothetical protein
MTSQELVGTHTHDCTAQDTEAGGTTTAAAVISQLRLTALAWLPALLRISNQLIR